MQPARTRSAARRETAGLTVLCVSREHNNTDGRVPTGPRGVREIGQSGVAVLGKAMPFPADCALPWSVWRTLHFKLSPGWSTDFDREQIQVSVLFQAQDILENALRIRINVDTRTCCIIIIRFGYHIRAVSDF